MSRCRLAITLFCLMTAASYAPAEQTQLIPGIQKITGFTANRALLRASSHEKPVALRSVKDAEKYFSDKELDELTRQVDFDKQFVLVFAWQGSGQDRLKYDVLESYPEQIVFSYKPGRTHDLRRHIAVFVLRSNVTWRISAIGGGHSDSSADEYVQVKVKGTLNSRVVAIGGETTGFTITANDITWELNFDGAAKLLRNAREWHRQTVIVTGKLTKTTGVERGDRWVIAVESLVNDEASVQD